MILPEVVSASNDGVWLRGRYCTTQVSLWIYRSAVAVEHEDILTRNVWDRVRAAGEDKDGERRSPPMRLLSSWQVHWLTLHLSQRDKGSTDFAWMTRIITSSNLAINCLRGQALQVWGSSIFKAGEHEPERR